MTAEEFIIDTIRAQGPVSFRDFMDMALYMPGAGYYTGARENFGCRGDYYTSPYLGKVFGDLVAKQVEEMWVLMGKEKFTIVEYGAGMGLLCVHIMNRLQLNPELFEKIDYCIIEKNVCGHPGRKNTLHDKVKWYDSISEIGDPVTGCILSNELVDNFPVHRVVMKDRLMEVFVDYENGFREIHKTPPAQLINYLCEFNVSLAEGYHTEINIEARKWVTEIAASLKKGFVMTIDYGYNAAEFYHPARSRGTLMCYHKHRRNEDPYDYVGLQDITAHVNFSSLVQWGIANGLGHCGYTTQSGFLLGLGLSARLRELENDEFYKSLCDEEKNALAQALLLDMGKKFKVLIQQKGIAGPRLSGLRFCRA
jgi:SAM-dependent MidA family methyltransferase